MALTGCAGASRTLPATPPPDTFVVGVAGDHAIELRYTGIGSQDPARFRVVLEGTGEADGVYDLAAVTGDSTWTTDDRYVLNQTTLGASAPLSVQDVTTMLQYNDDGQWRTLFEGKPSD